MFSLIFLMLKLIFEGFNQSSELENSSKEVYFLLFFELILFISIVILGLKLGKMIIRFIRGEKNKKYLKIYFDEHQLISLFKPKNVKNI